MDVSLAGAVVSSCTKCFTPCQLCWLHSLLITPSLLCRLYSFRMLYLSSLFVPLRAVDGLALCPILNSSTKVRKTFGTSKRKRIYFQEIIMFLGLFLRCAFFRCHATLGCRNHTLPYPPQIPTVIFPYLLESFSYFLGSFCGFVGVSGTKMCCFLWEGAEAATGDAAAGRRGRCSRGIVPCCRKCCSQGRWFAALLSATSRSSRCRGRA